PHNPASRRELASPSFRLLLQFVPQTAPAPSLPLLSPPTLEFSRRFFPSRAPAPLRIFLFPPVSANNPPRVLRTPSLQIRRTPSQKSPASLSQSAPARRTPLASASAHLEKANPACAQPRLSQPQIHSRILPPLQSRRAPPQARARRTAPALHHPQSKRAASSLRRRSSPHLRLRGKRYSRLKFVSVVGPAQPRLFSVARFQPLPHVPQSHAGAFSQRRVWVKRVLDRDEHPPIRAARFNSHCAAIRQVCNPSGHSILNQRLQQQR